jgi:hypothetical protein
MKREMRLSEAHNSSKKAAFRGVLGVAYIGYAIRVLANRSIQRSDRVSTQTHRRAFNSDDVVSTDRIDGTQDRAGSDAGSVDSAMQFKSTDGRPAREPGWRSAIPSDLPVGPSDLEELGRWLPKKEMELLIELCERAQRDRDLVRPEVDPDRETARAVF